MAGRLVKIERPPPAPRADVVDMLREALAAAERGEIYDCAIICVDRDGASWSDYPVVEWPALVLAEAVVLQAEMVDSLRSE